MEQLTQETLANALRHVEAITKPSDIYYKVGPKLWKDEQGHLLKEDQLVKRLCEDMGNGFSVYLNDDTIMLVK